MELQIKDLQAKLSNADKIAAEMTKKRKTQM